MAENRYDEATGITFQLFRPHLDATTPEDFQGPLLAEIGWDSSEVSGHDTVAEVKQRLRTALSDLVSADDDVTLFLGSRPMQDDGLFYADHFILLPVWVQVALHDRPLEDVLARITQFTRA